MPDESRAASGASYFASQAAGYAAARPGYPDALFDFAASLAPARRVAWDCATGSGQAAVPLAERFARVVATDAGAEQLAHARPHPRVEYRQAAAEASGLPDESVDLVTVAQALHWFDRERFYAEARRVLVPGGAIVVWSYDDATIAPPTADALLQALSRGTLGPYWPPGRELVGAGYRGLDFPFDEVPAPDMVLEAQWTAAELAAYVRTWSSVARFRAAHGRDPVDDFERALAVAWPDPAARHAVRWPLIVRAGRVGARPR